MSPRPRWRYWLRSLRMRAFMVALVVAVAPLSVVAIVGVLEIRSEPQMARAAAAAAQDVAQALQDDPAALADPHKAVRQAARRHRVRLRLLDPSREVIADTDHTHTITAVETFLLGPDDHAELQAADDAQPPIFERAVPLRALADGTATECETWASGTLRVCQFGARVQRDGEVVGLIYALSAHRRAIRALYDLRFALLKLTLFVALGALGLGWWLGWRLVRPLHRLRTQALAQVDAVSPKPLDLRRDDEIGDLAIAFNRLLSALRERAQQNEAFVADLAHEFKNPVAAVRACAESLASANDSTPLAPERQARLARALRDSSHRLDALVTQFLELARAEAGMEGQDREPVALGELVAGVCEAIAAQDDYDTVTIEHETEALTVVGVAGGIETALRNLVHNAASFAGDGGTVRVVVRSLDREAIVEVHDDGPGIEPQDVPRVFDRFFTRRHGGTGTGLGLALVRAIATAHGGRVQVQSKVGHGTTFELRLPRKPPPIG